MAFRAIDPLFRVRVDTRGGYMSLIISSRANTLAGRKKQWRFHVEHAGIISFDEMMKAMAKSGSSATMPDIVKVLLLYRDTVSKLVSDGYFVQGPLGDHYLSAIGTVRDKDDRFMPKLRSSGHGYRLRFRPNRAVEAGIVSTVDFRREKDSLKRHPCPMELQPIYTSVAARCDRGAPLVVVKGEYARLRGAFLGFDPDNEELGVFLVRLHGSEGYRCGPYASVKPSLVIFGMAVDVPAGEYQLIVRTATKAGTIRSGALSSIVRVG